MRVALYHHLPPGGALRVVRDFVNLAPNGIEVDVFGLDDVTRPASPLRRVSSDSAAVAPYRLAPLKARWTEHVPGGHLVRSELAARLAAAERAVASSINGGSYDVAYIHPCWLSNAPAIVRRLTIPTLLYLHEVRRVTFEPSYRPRAPMTVRGMAGRMVADATDRALAGRDRLGVASAGTIACNSLYTAERVLASYGRSAHVTSPGVDESIFHPQKPRFDEEGGFVLSVGGLEPFKNHHVIVDALGRIPQQVRPRLVLVYERCDARYRSELVHRAAERGVAVIERRAVTDDELAKLYSQASATVLAAQLEPLGLTALESIACGTPVVAVREAGYRETITDGVNGVLVARDIDALAEAITRVVTGETGLAASHLLPRSILPRWSAQASVDEQVELLFRTAHA